jgi:hypothetical protein
MGGTETVPSAAAFLLVHEHNLHVRAEDPKVSRKFYEQCALLRICLQLGNEFAIFRFSKQHSWIAYKSSSLLLRAALSWGSILSVIGCVSLAVAG